MALRNGTEGDDRIVGPNQINADYRLTYSYLYDEDRETFTKGGLFGFGGNDTILGGSFSDRINGYEGKDLIYGNAGNDANIYIENPFKTLGYKEITFIDGGLYGDQGDDFIDGGSGYDLLKGGSGNDTLIGGIGSDGGLTDSKIESGRGVYSTDEDFINAGLFGEDGDDRLEGGDGSDYLDGGTGNDRLFGGNDDDSAVYYLSIITNKNGITNKVQRDTYGGLYGGDGEDTLDGGSGRDLLHGEGGNDFLIGGDGDDKGYTMRNVSRSGDTLTFKAGLYGGAGNDTLDGGAGNDALAGESGSDILIGGTGADQLTGGGGADKFLYNSVADSTVATSGSDLVRDFVRAQGDRIDLHFIDAVAGGSVNQAFKFIGSADFHDRAGELRAVVSGSNTLVSGDVNGDGAADFSIVLKGALTLQAGDFIL